MAARSVCVHFISAQIKINTARGGAELHLTRDGTEVVVVVVVEEEVEVVRQQTERTEQRPYPCSLNRLRSGENLLSRAFG